VKHTSIKIELIVKKGTIKLIDLITKIKCYAEKENSIKR